MRKKDEIKAKNIQDTVIKLTRLYGFQGISMSKIAKDCGVSSSTIYTYYENKDEMLHSIYHKLREKEYNNIYNSIDNSMNAKQTLRAIFLDYYSYIIRNEDEYYFIKLFSSCPCLYEEIKTKAYNVAIDNILNKFVSTGEVIDVDITIIHSLLAAPIERIAENYFTNKKKLSADEIDKTFELIWQGIKRN